MPSSGSVVQWQTPGGLSLLNGSGQATGSQLFQVYLGHGVALVRGPDYDSPEGEYCCVITTVPGQRRCVTLSECLVVFFFY